MNNQGRVNIHSSLCLPICTAPPLDQQQCASLVHRGIQEPINKMVEHQFKDILNMIAIITSRD